MKYPIYIVSKGRYANPLTAKLLIKSDIDFRIVVEPQEFEKYCNSIDESKILSLPFSNQKKGSYPARNWIWKHSINHGHSRHWIFDDNIRYFVRLNLGKRTNTDSKTAIENLEKFTDRYSNIAISGFNYRYFVTKKTDKPFVLNTHVYSALLIRNDLSFRWRLKYNEDVDLCLQALTRKWCTILLNAFLIEKITTAAKMKGGNQSELYQNNDPRLKLLKAKSLEEMWPDYVKTVIRFNRPHHYINWKQFKHPLRKRIISKSMNGNESKRQNLNDGLYGPDNRFHRTR